MNQTTNDKNLISEDELVQIALKAQREYNRGESISAKSIRELIVGHLERNERVFE